MATTFDHNKECFMESMGFSSKDIEKTSGKLADMSRFIIENGPKTSELTEEIAKMFSYNELLILSTLYLVEKTNKILTEHPELLLRSKIKDLLDALQNEEEN
jgi:hypothetical protein